ncbi:MAG: hypothetical protein ACRDRJ_15630 [Streptosporangiaceae bacterium]
MPLERLEAQICELAGHLTAATCRFLVLVADFDARRGYKSWDLPSSAAWLAWKCQLSPGTAREHARAARRVTWRLDDQDGLPGHDRPPPRRPRPDPHPGPPRRSRRPRPPPPPRPRRHPSPPRQPQPRRRPPRPHRYPARPDSPPRRRRFDRNATQP